jgi:hypothetical protein
LNGDTETIIRGVSSKAPHWAALIIVVSLFLVYMERNAMHAELLAEQRIETCHSVQEASNIVLTRLAEVLSEAAAEDALMRSQMNSLELTLIRHTDAIQELIRELGRGG